MDDDLLTSQRSKTINPEHPSYIYVTVAEPYNFDQLINLVYCQATIYFQGLLNCL